MQDLRLKQISKLSKNSRFSHLLILSFALLSMLIVAIPSFAHETGKQSSLEPVGKMHELRASHTATLLPNGKVLVAGGFKKVRTYDQVYFNSAELYDPKTKSFTAAGSLKVARCGHTATLLPNGKVLIAGGNNEQTLASAEVFDPQSKSFTLVGEMTVPRGGHTATLLKNGNVLIVGGGSEAWQSAELFNPTRQRFEPTGGLAANRLGHTATLLPDGKVLIIGGTDSERRSSKVFASAELYDPTKWKFTPTGNLTEVRYKHAAVPLQDGTVLIVGGSDERDWRGQSSSAELYDAKRGIFSRIHDMQAKRFKLPHGITSLTDGTILISGGAKKVEVYDFKTGAFDSVAQFDEPHYYSSATLLPDGSVLIAGGYNTSPQSTDKAWVYRKL